MMKGDQKDRANHWAIVLAGGFGRRLQGVTELFEGRPVPKQFCRFGTDRSLLQRTVDRLAPIASVHRTVVVVDASMLELAHQQLRDHRGVEVVGQPLERGTGPGILLPLVHVLGRDPRADVVLVPSDHDFGDAAAFLDPVRVAWACIARNPSRTCLLGAEPDHPATDLGWIVPRDPIPATNRPRPVPVERFVEKPPTAVAEGLFRSGALWNTMIVAARGAELLDLFRRAVPDVAGWFLDGAALAGTGRVDWEERYRHLPRADFSAHVLTTAANLEVLPIARSAGWTDLGTPRRLFEWVSQGSGSASQSGVCSGRGRPSPRTTAVVA